MKAIDLTDLNEEEEKSEYIEENRHHFNIMTVPLSENEKQKIKAVNQKFKNLDQKKILEDPISAKSKN